MSDSFQLQADFESLIVPSGGLFLPSGVTNDYLKGLDGNHYVLTGGDHGANINILCAETGTEVGITQTALRADMAGLGITNLDGYTGIPVLVPAPGTPYFYAIMYNPQSDVSFLVAAVLYKIVDDATLQCVGGVNMKTRNIGPGEGMYFGGNIFSVKVINNILFAFGSWHADVFNDGLVSVCQLPLTETFVIDLTAGSWSRYFEDFSALSLNFFHYQNMNRINQGLATLVPFQNNTWGVMLYIGQAEYDYINAHLSDNAGWAAVTRPGMYWALSTDVSLTDVTSAFGFNDIKRHRDGSVSSNYYDDYVSPSSFMISTRTYLLFARSYTLPADLEPIGTYARARIFQWDGTTATSAADISGAVFDPVADCGLPEFDRTNSYPQFIQGHYDPTDQVIRFVWYGFAGTLVFDYVFGGWIVVTPETVEAYALTFAGLTNPAFTDWQTADTLGFGADFVSELTTYYMLTDDTMLWMYSPYIFCYVQNSERAPAGLTMQAQWDWSADASTSKFARRAEVYRASDLEAVAVSKNRVRGKGRALRLNFQSEQSKDFNLLGWAVDINKNTRF